MIRNEPSGQYRLAVNLGCYKWYGTMNYNWAVRDIVEVELDLSIVDAF